MLFPRYPQILSTWVWEILCTSAKSVDKTVDKTVDKNCCSGGVALERQGHYTYVYREDVFH